MNQVRLFQRPQRAFRWQIEIRSGTRSAKMLRIRILFPNINGYESSELRISCPVLFADLFYGSGSSPQEGLQSGTSF
jgi:hypothetical protein